MATPALSGLVIEGNRGNARERVVGLIVHVLKYIILLLPSPARFKSYTTSQCDHVDVDLKKGPGFMT